MIFIDIYNIYIITHILPVYEDVYTFLSNGLYLLILLPYRYPHQYIPVCLICTDMLIYVNIN